MDYLQIDRSIFKNSEPDYLYHEGSDHKSKGKFEFALGYIGWSLGGAFAVGCGRGAIGELMNKETQKLSGKPWLTRMINGTMKYGSGYAQPAGTLVVFYSGLQIALGNLRAEDDINSIAAGALAGAIYRSPQGLNPALRASGIGALMATAWVFVNPESRLRLKETFGLSL
uniref:Mitochondrial import inner membrane translocase subunit TIM23 n=1 Tax=Rhabditophanes sp. KR3021 TaxID=114890 RepID=A0AC35U8U1_9BILA